MAAAAPAWWRTQIIADTTKGLGLWKAHRSEDFNRLRVPDHEHFQKRCACDSLVLSKSE